MTDDVTIFIIPAADQLCFALRQAVQTLGGPQKFFATLDNNPHTFRNEFINTKWQIRTLFIRCVEDRTFRDRLTETVSTEPEREFLSQFFDRWDVWKELNREDDEWLRLVFAGAPVEALDGAIPLRVNEVFRCVSAVYLDSYFEKLRVRTAIQLRFPDKQLGGESNLILAGAVDDVLDSIRMVLRSLLLTPEEANLFKIPKESEIIRNITGELEQVKAVVDRLLKQFEAMN